VTNTIRVFLFEAFMILLSQLMQLKVNKNLICPIHFQSLLFAYLPNCTFCNRVKIHKQ